MRPCWVLGLQIQPVILMYSHIFSWFSDFFFSSAVLQVWLQRDAVQLHVLSGTPRKAPRFLSLLGGFAGQWSGRRPCCSEAESYVEGELRWSRRFRVVYFFGGCLPTFLAAAFELEGMECRLSWQNWVKLALDADLFCRRDLNFHLSNSKTRQLNTVTQRIELVQDLFSALTVTACRTH